MKKKKKKKKSVLQNRVENLFFLVPNVHYFSTGRNSTFSYYVFVCLEYHVIIVCLGPYIYALCQLYVCVFVYLSISQHCFLLFHLLKYYCIRFNHCVRNMCVQACHRVAVVIMCLHFYKFIASKIVCLCVCLHGYNYSIIVY